MQESRVMPFLDRNFTFSCVVVYAVHDNCWQIGGVSLHTSEREVDLSGNLKVTHSVSIV